MTLLQKLRNTAYAALLTIIPANCGDISTCESDLDCKESRICQYDSNEGASFCMTPEEAAEQQNSAEENNRCGNSEFYGAHLREVNKCSLGTKEPFQEDCTGGLDSKYFNSDDEIDRRIPFTYFGNTLNFDWVIEHLKDFDLPRSTSLNLVKNPSPSDFSSFEECYPYYFDGSPSDVDTSADELAYRRAVRESEVLRVLCFFEKDTTLYLGKIDKLCSKMTVWRKTSYPWSDSQSCKSEEHGAWYDECHEEFPWVDPANFDSTGGEGNWY